MDPEPDHPLNVAGDSSDSAVAGAPQHRPLIWFGCCWLAGIILGGRWGNPLYWLLAAMISTAVMPVMLWFGRLRGVRVWGLIAVVLIGSAYSGARLRYVPDDSILRYIGQDSMLVQLTGVVDGSPVLVGAQRGAFAHFAAWEPPRTHFVLSVRSVITAQGEKNASGKLRVRIKQADHTLRSGELIRITGWLHGLEGPSNPGDRDQRQYLGRKGIDGWMSLDSSGNHEVLRGAAVGSHFDRVRDTLAAGAMWSLRLGLRHDTARESLLGALLLGVYDDGLDELESEFRRTGLIHILSISGAHLGILLGLTWLLARGLSPGPRLAAAAVLVVLALYLLVLPAQVPIIRAGVMASVLCVGQLVGRRIAAIELLALASFMVLLWRPGEVFDPGFQLSFAITAALLLYVRPVSLWILPEPLIGGLGITTTGHQWKHRWHRFKRL